MVTHAEGLQADPLIDIGTAPFVVRSRQGLGLFLFELHEQTGPLCL